MKGQEFKRKDDPFEEELFRPDAAQDDHAIGSIPVAAIDLVRSGQLFQHLPLAASLPSRHSGCGDLVTKATD
jgi:hypothetical protein